jgi:hypothetical protein
MDRVALRIGSAGAITIGATEGNRTGFGLIVTAAFWAMVFIPALMHAPDRRNGWHGEYANGWSERAHQAKSLDRPRPRLGRR